MFLVWELYGKPEVNPKIQNFLQSLTLNKMSPLKWPGELIHDLEGSYAKFGLLTFKYVYFHYAINVVLFCKWPSSRCLILKVTQFTLSYFASDPAHVVLFCKWPSSRCVIFQVTQFMLCYFASDPVHIFYFASDPVHVVLFCKWPGSRCLIFQVTQFTLRYFASDPVHVVLFCKWPSSHFLFCKWPSSRCLILQVTQFIFSYFAGDHDHAVSFIYSTLKVAHRYLTISAKHNKYHR